MVSEMPTNHLIKVASRRAMEVPIFVSSLVSTAVSSADVATVSERAAPKASAETRACSSVKLPAFRRST